MTWSIVARDAAGAFGVAVASRFFAVGALCPHAKSGVGALATQACGTRRTVEVSAHTYALLEVRGPFNLLGDGLRDALDPRHS